MKKETMAAFEDPAPYATDFEKALRKVWRTA